MEMRPAGLRRSRFGRVGLRRGSCLSQSIRRRPSRPAFILSSSHLSSLFSAVCYDRVSPIMPSVALANGSGLAAAAAVPQISLRDFDTRREAIKAELIDAASNIGFL